MGADLHRQFERAVSAWLATFTSPHTRSAYRRDLEVFGAWCVGRRLAAQRVTARHLQQFGRERLEGGDSAGTVQRRLSAVSSFYRHAGAAMSAVNPADATARPAMQPRAVVRLSTREVDDVWRTALGQGSRTAVLIGLVLFDGMKSHEVLRLDASHLQLVNERWHLRAPVDDPSPTALHPSTSDVLTAYLGSRRHGPLLLGENPTRTPARLTRFGVDYLVKSVGRGAGLATPLTVNVLRNTHAALTWSPRRESNP